MADTGSITGHAADNKETKDNMAKWPLSFKLQLPNQQQGQQTLTSLEISSKQPAKNCWWSHRLYKGPENKEVQILYSRTKQDSERIVQHFLNEPVVGFDMEWPWNDYKKPDLQNKIGLIQIASLDKIALFHIGLHLGKTTDDIIAPSLRKLIESPKIGKLGVGILSADFSRMRRFFKLDPKGAIELSHLYRLVKFGGWKSELVSTKMVSLAHLVEDQLGHPLFKGDVRTSNWSKPLSKDQINYAAADAYAGYMLYHCMNYKRSKMSPTPPLPVYAEKYAQLKMGGKLSSIGMLRLDALDEEGNQMTSEKFFGVAMSDSAPSRTTKTVEKKTASEPKLKATKLPKELEDAASQALYIELLLHRAALAEKAGLPVYRITTNPVLVALALERPTDKDSLLAIKGLGPKQQEAYGKAWLDLIAQFLDPNSVEPITTSVNATTMTTVTAFTVDYDVQEPSSTPVRSPRRRRKGTQESPDSSPAFGSPIQRTPNLHTGLSFSMAETKLDAEEADTDIDNASCASDESLPSLDFGTTPSKPPQLKRKRNESPSKATFTASQCLQEMTQVAPLLAPANFTLPPDTTTRPPATPLKAGPVHFTPLTPRSRISKNKLQALSRLVTSKLGRRPPDAPPIVSDRTLSLIIIRAPKTIEELEKIPGIDSFMLACQQTGTNLLKNVLKFSSKTQTTDLYLLHS